MHPRQNIMRGIAECILPARRKACGSTVKYWKINEFEVIPGPRQFAGRGRRFVKPSPSCRLTIAVASSTAALSSFELANRKFEP